MIEEVLDSAGVELHYGAGDEISICCPFCVGLGETEDTRFRLGINTVTGEAQCFNCGWRSGGLEWTIKELCDVFHVARPKVSLQSVKTVQKIPDIPRRGIGLPAEYEKFGKNADEIGKKAYEYVQKRGISLFQVVAHKIGYAAVGELAWRVLFPFIDADGEIHGCAGRAILPHMQPKYKNTKGMRILWNAHKADCAVVVEGVIDALHVETALLGESSTIAVARLGSGLSGDQLEQLKQYKQIIVFPDRDKAGLHGARAVAERCAQEDLKVKIIIPDRLDGKDPGEMPAEHIRQAIQSAVPWSAASSAKLRVLAARLVW